MTESHSLHRICFFVLAGLFGVACQSSGSKSIFLHPLMLKGGEDPSIVQVDYPKWSKEPERFSVHFVSELSETSMGEKEAVTQQLMPNGRNYASIRPILRREAGEKRKTESNERRSK